jgi:hypothetical protein
MPAALNTIVHVLKKFLRCLVRIICNLKSFFFLFVRLASAIGDQPPSSAPTLLSFPAVENISDPSPGTDNTAPTKGGSTHCYLTVFRIRILAFDTDPDPAV